MKGAQITNIEQAKEFAMAGNATFTVVSKASNNRYTFKIQKGKKKDAPHFVKFMNGNDNESSFQFLGTIFEEKTYRHSKKAHATEDSTVAKTFNWLFKVLNGNFDESKFNLIEFWHEGKCGKCGRKLTVPSSIETGMGPSCSGKADKTPKKEKIRNNKIDVLLND
jgi:hypothetical protein